ncbi:MAG: hypothetical protein Q8L01_03320 [Candidatus Woesebacteria bacterium]|nr:hypothetical protein [Candidatus Woesebacteria bacterium]
MEGPQEKSNDILAKFNAIPDDQKERFGHILNDILQRITNVEERLKADDLGTASGYAYSGFQFLIGAQFINDAGFKDLQYKAATIAYRIVLDCIKREVDQDDLELEMSVTHTLIKTATNAQDENYPTLSKLRKECVALWDKARQIAIEKHEEIGDFQKAKAEIHAKIKPLVTEFLKKISSDEIFEMDVYQELDGLKAEAEEILRFLPVPKTKD